MLSASGGAAAAEAAGEPEGRPEAVRAQAQEEGEGGQGVNQGDRLVSHHKYLQIWVENPDQDFGQDYNIESGPMEIFLKLNPKIIS